MGAILTDRQILMRAIVAAPDDMAPKLAYADWIEQHSDDECDLLHAKFITLSCRREMAMAALRDGTAKVRDVGDLCCVAETRDLNNFCWEHSKFLSAFLCGLLGQHKQRAHLIHVNHDHITLTGTTRHFGWRAALDAYFQGGFLRRITTTTTLLYRHSRKFVKVNPIVNSIRALDRNPMVHQSPMMGDGVILEGPHYQHCKSPSSITSPIIRAYARYTPRELWAGFTEKDEHYSKSGFGYYPSSAEANAAHSSFLAQWAYWRVFGYSSPTR